jgi:hypothetical protein
MSTELYAWPIGGLALGTAIAGRTPAAAGPPRLWPSVAGPAGLIVALLPSASRAARSAATWFNSRPRSWR